MWRDCDNTQQSTLNTQPSTFNTQHSTFNKQHSTLNTQQTTNHTQHSTLDTRHSTLNTEILQDGALDVKLLFVMDEEGVDESGESNRCDGYMGCRT